jgi:hypothetical protein
VLSAGCGGGDDHATVEANLHRYLINLVPEESPFPIGAGAPRAKDNSCNERHDDTKGFVLSTRALTVKSREGLALWACVVKFGTYPMPVVVAVDDGSEVVEAMPGGFKLVNPQ